MNDYFHSDDELLVSWTINGDSRAFGEIVRRYESMVARTVKGMLGDIQQAEDTGQDTFIRLYNSLSNFRGEAKLSTYIQRIAINLSLNELKKRRRFFSLFVRSENRENGTEREIPDNSTNEEEDIDLKEVLNRALDRLPVEFRVVVILRLIHGYSTKESAGILDIPVGTVLSRLSRARDQLQTELNKLM